MPGGSLWGMHTFETSIRSSSFRLAVLLLPLGFWAVVQTVATQARDEPMRAVSLIAIVGLANALPLAALLWMLCSVAGYTVEPGRVIEHRVVRDREIPLDALVEEPRSANGVITLRLRRRTMRLRVTGAGALPGPVARKQRGRRKDRRPAGLDSEARRHHDSIPLIRGDTDIPVCCCFNSEPRSKRSRRFIGSDDGVLSFFPRTLA